MASLLFVPILNELYSFNFQDKLVFQRTERVQSSCFHFSPDCFLGTWCVDLGTSSAGLLSCSLIVFVVVVFLTAIKLAWRQSAEVDLGEVV